MAKKENGPVTGYEPVNPDPQSNRPRRVNNPSIMSSGLISDVKNILEDFDNAPTAVDAIRVVLDAANNTAERQIARSIDFLSDITEFAKNLSGGNKKIDVLGQGVYKSPSSHKTRNRLLIAVGFLTAIPACGWITNFVGNTVTGGGRMVSFTEKRFPDSYSWSTANFFDTNKKNIQERIRERDVEFFIDCQKRQIQPSTSLGVVEPYIKTIKYIEEGNKQTLLDTLNTTNNLTPEQKKTVIRDINERFDALSERMKRAPTQEAKLNQFRNFLISNIDPEASEKEKAEQLDRADRIIAAIRGYQLENDWWDQLDQAPPGPYWAKPKEGGFECANPIIHGDIRAELQTQTDDTAVVTNSKRVVSGRKYEGIQVAARDINKKQPASYNSGRRRI